MVGDCCEYKLLVGEIECGVHVSQGLWVGGGGGVGMCRLGGDWGK